MVSGCRADAAEAEAGSRPASAYDTMSITDSVEIRIAQPLWTEWFAVALEHDFIARVARVDLIRTNAAGLPFAAAMTKELAAALVSVSASAHALDALYGEFVTPEIRAAGPRPGAKREAHIRECLKRRFSTGAKRDERWVHQFRWLFDLRDAAVHARYESALAIPHPSGIGYSAKNPATYSADAAGRALDLLADVLTTCVESPKPADADALSWSSSHRATVEEMLARLLLSREVQPLTWKSVDPSG